MNPQWIWVGICAYVVLCLVAAVASRPGVRSPTSAQNMSEYFLGGRRMGGFVSALSYSATTYSAFMLIGLAGLTYAGGVGALGFELLYLCGVTLILIFGPRFWRVGKHYGIVTPSEMLAHRYRSRALAVVSALASCVFLIPYAAVQLAGVGYLVSGISGGSISFLTGTLVAVILAIAFAMIAGLRSVAWTDALQAVLMLVGAGAVVLLLLDHFGGLPSFLNQLEADPGALSVPGEGFFNLSTFIALSLPWVFFAISNPQVSQRLYTPASMKQLRIMLLGFMVFGLFYTLIAITWGFSARLELPGLSDSDMATPALLGSGIIPAPLAIIVMVGILAACVSTIDSILLTLSSMLSRDVYLQASPRAGERAQLLVGKLVIPVIATVSLWFAHLQLDLIAVLSVSASAGLLVIVPATIGAFFWRGGTAAGAISSIIVAGALVLGLEWSGTLLLGQGSGVWGLAVASALYIGVSLIDPRRRRASAATFRAAEEFITIARGGQAQQPYRAAPATLRHRE